MLKKLFMQFCVGMLLLGSFLPSVSAESPINDFTGLGGDTEAQVESTDKIVNGKITLPDNDIGYKGMTYIQKLETFYTLREDKGAELGHTGFSMAGYPYSDEIVVREDGTMSHYLNGDYAVKVQTDYGHIGENTYYAKDFTAEQLGVTAKEYALLVEKNVTLDVTVDSRDNGDDDLVHSEMYYPTAEEIKLARELGLEPMAMYYRDNDVELTFTVKIPENPPPPPPSDDSYTVIVYVPPTWGTGKVSWGMFKDTLAEKGSSETKIRWTNGLVSGSHYAQTADKHTMSGIASSSNKTVDTKAGNKGTETYSLAYTYTDYRIDTYVCTGYDPVYDDEGDIVDWECEGYALASSAPYWENGSSYSCSVDLAVDHRYGETMEGEHGFEETMKIGRSASVTAEDCVKTENTPNTETISHKSQEVKLPTQTYTSFMEQPIEWKGNPMYNVDTIFPHQKGKTEEGFAGVPELDDSFKKLNKYTTKHEPFENPYAIPLRNEVSGTSMNVFSQDDFWVSRSTGYVTSTEHGMSLADVKSQTEDEFSAITGQIYQDSILDREDLTSMYYLPIDANDNVMKPNTEYKMETQVNGLGYNNITLMHDQKYQFENYLLGSVFEEDVENEADFEGVWIVEQNEIPYNDVKYAYSVTVTPEQAATIHNATHGRTNFIFGHKGTDNMTVYDQLKDILGNKFGEKLAKSIPHVIDRESANETL